MNWTLVSSITQLNIVLIVSQLLMKSNSIDVLTYNNTLLVYPDPLGVSVNVTCIAMIGGVNYSQSIILHGIIIL